MMKFSLRVLPALAVVLLAAPLVAQGPGRGMGGVGIANLVTNKGVIEELKLTDEQKEKLAKSAKEIRAKHGDDMKAAFEEKDFEKLQKIQKEINGELIKVADSTLKPEQVKRLHQIEIWATLQMAGPAVFSNEKVEKALKFSDKQKTGIKEVTEKLNKARQEAFQEAQGDREKMQEALAKLRKTQSEMMEKFQGTLSEEQKKAWKELTGEKFELKLGGPPR